MGVSRRTPQVSYKSSAGGSSSGTTSIALSCGTAVDSTDYLIIGISRAGAGSGATYAGKPLTLITSALAGGFGSLFQLPIADTVGVTGTNNVVTSSSGGFDGMFACVYRISFADPSFVDAATANGSSISLVATGNNQIALALNAALGNGTGPVFSVSWSAAVSEDFDTGDFSRLNGLSGAHSGLTSGTGTISITATQTGGDQQGLMGVLIQGSL